MNFGGTIMIKVYKLSDLSGFFMCLLFICALLIYPEICIQGAKDGITLALYTVIPSIFPFMVSAKYLLYSGNAHKISKITDKLFYTLFNIPKNASIAFIIGIISGFPVGGSVLSDLTKNKVLTQEHASYMLGYSNNCSPLFIIGTVGSVFLKDSQTGYILYTIHLFSAIILAFLSKSKITPQKSNICNPKKENSPFIKAVSDSSITILNISCYIIFFSVITNLILILISYDNMLLGMFAGSLELSNGINIISSIELNPVLKLSVISALLGFSGFCVLFQTNAVTYKEKLSAGIYLKSKLQFALISFILSFVIFSIIGY